MQSFIFVISSIAGVCDFEDPTQCGFRNDQSLDLQWGLNNGRTSSYGTGPKNDHTYGTSSGKNI